MPRAADASREHLWQPFADGARWFVTPKYDGHLVVWDGVELWSKNHGINWNDSAPPWLLRQLPAEMPFVGELCVGTDAQSLVTELRGKPAHPGWQHVRIMVFYTFVPRRQGCLPWHVRMDQAEQLLARSGFVRVVPRKLVSSWQEFCDHFRHLVDDEGMEGAMLYRDTPACMGVGRATGNIWKVRSVAADQGVIKHRVFSTSAPGQHNIVVDWQNPALGRWFEVELQTCAPMMMPGDAVWFSFRGVVWGKPLHARRFVPTPSVEASLHASGLPAVRFPLCGWSARRLVARAPKVFPKLPAAVAPDPPLAVRPSTRWTWALERGEGTLMPNAPAPKPPAPPSAAAVGPCVAIVASRVKDEHKELQTSRLTGHLQHLFVSAARIAVGFSADSTFFPVADDYAVDGGNGMTVRFMGFSSEAAGHHSVAAMLLTICEYWYRVTEPRLAGLYTANVPWGDPRHPVPAALVDAVTQTILDWWPALMAPALVTVLDTTITSRFPELQSTVVRRADPRVKLGQEIMSHARRQIQLPGNADLALSDDDHHQWMSRLPNVQVDLETRRPVAVLSDVSPFAQGPETEDPPRNRAGTQRSSLPLPTRWDHRVINAVVTNHRGAALQRAAKQLLDRLTAAH
jgi:hypothetical protein